MSYEGVVTYDKPSGYWRCDDTDPKTRELRATAGSSLTSDDPVLSFTVTDSPIIGDRGGAVRPQTGFVRSVSDNDPEDFRALPEFSVEMWFRWAGNPTPIVLLVGPSNSGMGTTGFFELQLANPGRTVSFIARNNANSAFTATSAALQAATWYYIVGVVSGSSTLLYLNGAQVASASWSGTTPVAWDTSFSKYTLGGVSGGDKWDFDEIALYRYGLPAARIAAHYQAGRQRGFPQQVADERFGAVLDAAGSHAPRKYGGAATYDILPTFMEGQDPLGELRQAARVEAPDGLFFAGKDGTLTFLANDHRQGTPWNTVQATFGDAGGAELPYLDLNLDFSESFLYNEANVTRDGGLLQTASDTASIAKFFRRSISITGLERVTDADALDLAQALVVKHKNPMTRILSIDLSTAEPAVTEAVFRLELGDRIRILRTPPGGGARLDQTSFVQKISVEGANDGRPWRVTLSVSPL